jgi:ABC-2 type transport system permease protein
MVPAILKTTPFVIWSNTMMSPQIMLMYAGALLSAILSIAIFRDYRDNGTELIMVSKPINRQKIIFAKLLIFIITSIGFALVSCIVCVFTLGFKEVNGYQTFSLVISTFIANAIFCLIFGFIATVISLFLNKI